MALPALTFGSSPTVIRKSLARIFNTAQNPNYKQPWLAGHTGGGLGTAWVVSKDRLLTNAHVVSDARFLTLEKESDPKKYIAEVEFVAHDCDLALIKVNDPAFFNDTVPLQIGDIPEIESEVSVYGYPIGGDRMSVTRGVVSRIDFRSYAHSVIDSHLSIQIDAAINPGNSGGPVLQNGKVVGVAFQGFSGDVAQNVGYMIPTPVVRRFLKDIEDGFYDRYMDLSLTVMNALNPAMRKALGLPNDDRGVMVATVSSAGISDGLLFPGDAILSIDDLPVASDGTVELNGERISMAEIVERKFRGESVKLKVIRKREPLEVTVPLSKPWPFTMQSNQFDVQPTYVMFAGLVFQPLSRNLLAQTQIQNARINYLFETFVSREVYKERPEVVILTSILPDVINTFLADFREGIVDEINGDPIKSLKDVSEAFKKETEFHVIKFLGNGRPLVLENAVVKAASDRIRIRYGVTRDELIEDSNR